MATPRPKEKQDEGVWGLPGASGALPDPVGRSARGPTPGSSSAQGPPGPSVGSTPDKKVPETTLEPKAGDADPIDPKAQGDRVPIDSGTEKKRGRTGPKASNGDGDPGFEGRGPKADQAKGPDGRYDPHLHAELVGQEIEVEAEDWPNPGGKEPKDGENLPATRDGSEPRDAALIERGRNATDQLIEEYGFSTVDAADAENYRQIKEAKAKVLERLIEKLAMENLIIPAATLAQIGQKLAQMEKDQLAAIEFKVGKPSDRAKPGKIIRARIGIASPPGGGPAQAALELEVEQ